MNHHYHKNLDKQERAELLKDEQAEQLAAEKASLQKAIEEAVIAKSFSPDSLTLCLIGFYIF